MCRVQMSDLDTICVQSLRQFHEIGSRGDKIAVVLCRFERAIAIVDHIDIISPIKKYLRDQFGFRMVGMKSRWFRAVLAQERFDDVG